MTRRRWFLCLRMLAVLAVAAFWFLAAGRTSQALPPQAEVSADSILATARDLSGETGIGPPSRFAPLPTTGIYARYLLKRLDDALKPLGGYAVLDTFYPGLDYHGPHEIRTAYTDVVGWLPGAMGGTSPGLFLLGAHFDGTSQADSLTHPEWDKWTSPAPGADDNGSGVGSILEALRVAAARNLRPQAGVMITFFDGEEQQLIERDRFLLGSRYLADSVFAAGKLDPLKLYGVVNLDMVSYNPRRDSLAVITNIPSRWLANDLLDVHRGGAAPGLALSRLVKGLTYSDHASFWADGYDAVLLIEAPDIVDHNPYYHTMRDLVPNTYSRNGAMAAKASELLLGLLQSWAQTGPESLVVSADGILVQKGVAVDLATVDAGEEVSVVVRVANRGGVHTAPMQVELATAGMDGKPIRTVSSVVDDEVLPPGAAARLTLPWTPDSRERGAVRLQARVISGSGRAMADKLIAVRGGAAEVPQAFVYPNPTAEPSTAVVGYSLTQPGPVRIGVLSLNGRLLAQTDIPYDPVYPDSNVTAGRADVPLSRVLHGTTLAPGLYLLRVELFGARSGAGADVAMARFVVLR